MRVAIQTLGCKVNQSESASIEGILRNNNYEIVKSTDKADVFIVNTCTVTAKSDYQSRQLIRKAVRSGARVIATGCYAQLRAGEVSEIDGIDIIIGNSGKLDILNYLNKLNIKNGKPYTEVDSPTTQLTALPYYSSRSRAFLKIQDGCNFSCSYCTVPLARGKSRSLTQEDVITASSRLASDGYKEIVLTGIHIGTYGLDLTPRGSLIEVVKRLVDNCPQLRIRLGSIEPHELKDEFLKLIADGAVCPHLHIPIQSGSDKILKAMNRGYTTEFFKQVINNIITSCPDVSIGTDLIVGFPGESDKDFNETVKFIDMLPLSYLHVFPYAKRPNTKASLFSDQIGDRIKKERVNSIIEIGKIKKKTYMMKNIGRILDVIVEKRSKSNGFYTAISDNYLRLFIKSNTIGSGERLKARVTSLTETGLIVEPLE